MRKTRNRITKIADLGNTRLGWTSWPTKYDPALIPAGTAHEYPKLSWVTGVYPHKRPDTWTVHDAGEDYYNYPDWSLGGLQEGWWASERPWASERRMTNFAHAIVPFNHENHENHERSTP